MIQKPVVVILGNADNIGCLTARAFAAQGAVIAMLNNDRAAGDRMMGSLPGGNHLHVVGQLDHAADLASFAGLVDTLYGRVDELICCEDAGVMVPHLQCSARMRMAMLLEGIFVPEASIVNMASRSRKMTAWRRRKGEEGPSDVAACLARRDIRVNQIVLHRTLVPRIGGGTVTAAACAAALFLCSEEAVHIHREYVVVNGRKASWRFHSRPVSSPFFLKPYLDFCAACMRPVFLYA